LAAPKTPKKIYSSLLLEQSPQCLLSHVWNCVKRRKGSEQESKERWGIDYLDKLEFGERDIIMMIP
jgi:hypothetical protein